MRVMFSDVPTETIDVDGTPFVYRRLGPRGGVPVVFFHHFSAVLDDWDPRVVDGVAAGHHVIIFDNRGVGGSGGATPSSVPEMAKDAAALVRALGFQTIDALGFELGGYVAQSIVHQQPDLVRRLVLAGTAPAGGTSPTHRSSAAELVWQIRTQAAAEKKHPKQLLFFQHTKDGQVAAAAFLARLEERKIDRIESASPETIQAQAVAIADWLKDDVSASLSITIPTFIVNGDRDLTMSTACSFDLLQRIPESKLAIYPGGGHGALFQFHELFVQQVLDFLN